MYEKDVIAGEFIPWVVHSSLVRPLATIVTFLLIHFVRQATPQIWNGTIPSELRPETATSSLQFATNSTTTRAIQKGLTSGKSSVYTFHVALK
jgi:hypothetical protein